MKRGQSYITVWDDQKPKHKLVKALHVRGIKNFFLVYATHMATDAGWTFMPKENCTISPWNDSWLGYTMSEAIKRVNNFELMTIGEKQYFKTK
jgi:hypothetical protein